MRPPAHGGPNRSEFFQEKDREMGHRLRANPGSWARGLDQLVPHSLRRNQPADSSPWNRKNKAPCVSDQVCGRLWSPV